MTRRTPHDAPLRATIHRHLRAGLGVEDNAIALEMPADGVRLEIARLRRRGELARLVRDASTEDTP